MRLIDADALLKTLNDEGVPFNVDVNYFVMNAPTVDAVQVVGCKNCRWYSVKGKTTMYGWCDANWLSVNETDYCSKGERKEP